ncbi:MAG: DNA translocase FtsK [bacterium]|nr:DNA translocase FtsK [bacterium]
MSKKKHREKEGKRATYVSSETKKSILGVLLIAVSIILILASFNKAGPAGTFLFKTLSFLFGLGYYLIPLICFIVGILFLLSREQKFFSIVFFGMLFFILSGLGLIDILFPEQGGWIGRLAGTLEIPFGRGAALVLTIALVVVSLLITLNASIKLRWPGKKTQLDETVTDVDDNDEDIEAALADNDDEDNEEEKIKEKEKPFKQAHKEITEKDLQVAEAAAFKPNPKSKSAVMKNYVAPPLSLLKSISEKPTPGDLRANANIIKRTLESFGIPVEMGEINIGPKVTRYTLKPAEGVKLNRITALGSDLSLALAAHPIRIEAPIPGKSLVGIEVPNKAASIVRLGSLLAYPDFTAGPLVFPIGRDVTGEPIFGNINKLPHLLVAGATGSGKSIFIHSIIIPLLFKNSPSTLKMILIDPKRVELSIYDGIPHLIAPVITEGKKTIAVFRWALSEMDRRYQLLQNAGSRDVTSFNKSAKEEDILPYIVIMIDELADLMATYGREVEGYIVRLAQMARATGIHLVLATQRPSVEVVTGLIKANITARVALQVASQIDSRTIIDSAGAEKLLGGGDLLYISNEYSRPKRIQGGYISEEEIRDVVNFIKKHNETLAPSEASAESEALQKSMASDKPGQLEAKTGDVFDDYMGTNADEDEMLPQAIDFVKKAGKASASLLQRRLGVGYARAARLLDIMEEKGLIGPGDGAKPREVFIVNEENPGVPTVEIEEEQV